MFYEIIDVAVVVRCIEPVHIYKIKTIIYNLNAVSCSEILKNWNSWIHLLSCKKKQKHLLKQKMHFLLRIRIGGLNARHSICFPWICKKKKKMEIDFNSEFAISSTPKITSILTSKLFFFNSRYQKVFAAFKHCVSQMET